MQIVLFHIILSILSFGLPCLAFQFDLKPDCSLITTISEAVKNGISCKTIIEQYRTKISSPFLNLLNDALADAVKLDETYYDKKVQTKGRFHCLPTLIWKEEDEADHSSLRTTTTFEYYRKRGALALATVTAKSLPLLVNYPVVVLGAGNKVFNKLIHSPHLQGNNSNNCSIWNVIVFRLNSFRENICISASCLKDLSLLANSTNDLLDTREINEINSMRIKTVGIIRGAFSPINVDDQLLADKLTQSFHRKGVAIKNVTINDNELTSILRNIVTLSDCQSNLSKETNRNDSRQSFTSDYWSRVDNGSLIADSNCWLATKRRYRYQIRFVKRIAEPLFGNNDFIILPNFHRYLSNNSDFVQFISLMAQSQYPVIQYNTRCFSSSPVMFLARPDRLSAIIEAASELDQIIEQSVKPDTDKDTKNLITVLKSDVINFIPRDYCGEIILNGITIGNQAVFAYDLCGPNGMCVNTDRGFKCDCAPGHSGRFCHEVAPPFAVIQKCVLYPTYQTVINNLTVTCPEQTSCVPAANRCLLNYCDNPYGWCLAMDDLLIGSDNSRRH